MIIYIYDSGVRPQTVDRGNACEGLRKESWKKNPGRGILEDDPWNRNHGEEKPWRRGPGGGNPEGILKEESSRGNPRGGILEEES